MSRRKQFRRRASLPLQPHVVAALRLVRKSLSALNSLLLPSELPVDTRLHLIGPVALELQKDVINFTSALLCSVPNENLAPSLTIDPTQLEDN